MFKYIFILLIFIPITISGEYKNTNGKEIDKSIKDLIRWQRNQKKPVLSSINLSDEWKTSDLNKNHTIWIGHSTFIIKVNNLTILTDPVFSDRASPFRKFGPKRLIPPSISLEELPKIDVITISHNHYDHLDIRSLKKLSKINPDLIFLIPKGDLDIFKKRKITNVKEFMWWEDIKIDEFTFTFTPVQHWSARGLFDRNESLWGGWFMQGNKFSIYHAGDTGYSQDFVETKEKLGSPKYAFIPIGAYDPEWFMSESHVNPEDAIKIMNDLDAEFSFGMHWGTFALTAEDTAEPPERLNKELEKNNIENFNVLIPGEVIYLDQ
jgi:L-ascorbate metabolism protein UlaG (beta-lactamase superfamily)